MGNNITQRLKYKESVIKYKLRKGKFLMNDNHRPLELSVETINLLGNDFVSRGDEASFEIGIGLLEKAASLNDIKSKYDLGLALYSRYYNGSKYNDKIISLLSEASKNGNVEAKALLGSIYTKGIIVDMDLDYAVSLLNEALEEGSKQASFGLKTIIEDYMPYSNKRDIQIFNLLNKAIENGLEDEEVYSEVAACYILGKGTQVDYSLAEKILRDNLNFEENTNNYFIRTLKKINGKKIIQIPDISKISIEEIEQEEIGGIVISPENNKDIYSHTIYAIDDFKQMYNIVQEVLEDVPEVSENRDNEFEIFMQIMVKLGKMISYDYEERARPIKKTCDNNWVESNSLLKGLLMHKSLCSGYTEILRNCLSMRGIESLNIYSTCHSFNQVKLGDKWYYVDLTNCADKIKKGEEFHLCLLSEDLYSDFLKKCLNDNIKPSVFKYDSSETYDQEKVKEMAEKFYKLYGITGEDYDRKDVQRSYDSI